MSGQDAESEIIELQDDDPEFWNDYEDGDALDTIDRRISELHPLMLYRVVTFTTELRRFFETGAMKTRWQVFELCRSPERQRLLHAAGASPDPGWHSPHQYGLAIDLTPYGPDGEQLTVFTAEHRQELEALANKHGLSMPDRQRPWHLEAPEWEPIKTIIFRPDCPIGNGSSNN